MAALAPMAATVVAEGLKKRTLVLIDIREPDEYAREHIEGAVSLPLSKLADAAPGFEQGRDIVFQCRSGSRTSANCAQLAARVGHPAFHMEGGLYAWKKAGLPVEVDTSAPLELNRQVQIAAGTLVLGGVVMAAAVHPAFIAVSAFVGAGLVFAGVSGWCGMAKLLAIAPWNRRIGA